MTRYRSLLTSVTFCQWVKLQPAINIATMHLSWAYGCLIKGTLGVLRELGLQNCDKWLCNSIIYSTSCETDKRTPSTGWYHWHLSLHQNASIISVLFYIIAASALCKNVVPTNESRYLSRSSTNSSRRSQILSSWFWSLSTKHLIKFLSGPYLVRITCIYSWHGGPRYTDLLRFLWNAGCVYQCSICNSLSSWLANCLGKCSQKFGNCVS